MSVAYRKIIDRMIKIIYILFIKYIGLKLTYWMEAGEISMTAFWLPDIHLVISLSNYKMGRWEARQRFKYMLPSMGSLRLICLLHGLAVSLCQLLLEEVSR